MRRYNLFTIMACLLFVIGCDKDSVSYDDSSTTTTPEGDYGYLVLPDVMYVDLTSETFNQTSTTTSSSEETKSDLATKADDGTDLAEVSDEYLVTITNLLENSVAYDSNYGELKQLEQLALPPSSYSIYVRSTDEIPNVGSDAHYSGSANFVISTNMTTILDNLSCSMNNIKTSITMSADVLDLFQPDSETAPEENLAVLVSLEDNVATYTRDNNGEVYYFKALESTNTLYVELNGMYNIAAANEEPNYVAITGWKQSVSGVKAGQWRNISINVDYASHGTADFTITVETWTYDEVIDVDITKSVFQLSFGESVLDDPENYITDVDSPTVTQGEKSTSLDVAFSVNQNSFSLNSSLQAVCVDPLILNAVPVEGATLSELWIEYTSDNASFNSWLESTFGENRRNYILSDGSVSSYYTQSDNSFQASYNMMYQFYLYSGSHTATIMAKDSEGRASFNTLVIASSNEGVELPSSAPTIEWRGDYDFANRYVIDPVDGLDVVIDITSESGITGFLLIIDSEVLSASDLADINLADTMDLINPGSCEAALLELGFPVKDDVLGQTEMVFDISSFMPMLTIMGAGNSDFWLSVTDAGGTTEECLKVKVE